MARPSGSRNEGYDERRSALIARLRERLREPGPRPSLRELSAAAQVSLPTLRHYFTDREGLVRAVMTDELDEGREPLSIAATPSGPLERSVRDLLEHAATGLAGHGLTDAHAVGLAEGLASAASAADYLNRALEPTLEAFAARLAEHERRGELRPGMDLRVAALQLLAPLLLAHLHQSRLGGDETHPLDLVALRDELAVGFVRGNGRDRPGLPHGERLRGEGAGCGDGDG